MTLLIDTFEPEQAETLMAPSIPVSRLGLNPDYADYVWHAGDGHTIQVERKTAGEILNNIDNVELQLRHEMVNAEETILLCEGVFEPLSGVRTSCIAWRKVPKGKSGEIMVPGHTFHTSYGGVQAWFSQLDKAGITIVHTLDYHSTAYTLIALYKNSQKPEHTTLRRYIKPRIDIAPYNPHILTLMGIEGARIGEETARAWIARFGTSWYTINQDIESLAETLMPGGTKKVGMVAAKRLLKSLGRQA